MPIGILSEIVFEKPSLFSMVVTMVKLARDPIGVIPLYMGKDDNDTGSTSVQIAHFTERINQINEVRY